MNIRMILALALSLFIISNFNLMSAKSDDTLPSSYYKDEYRDKIENVGSPLSPQMENFLLNKEWCHNSRYASRALDKYTKYKDSVYIQENTILPNIGKHIINDNNKVHISMINDKEFVITKFTVLTLGVFEAKKQHKVFYRSYYKIVNNSQFVKTVGVGGEKEGNRWVISKSLGMDDDPSNVDEYRYFLCK